MIDLHMFLIMLFVLYFFFSFLNINFQTRQYPLILGECLRENLYILHALTVMCVLSQCILSYKKAFSNFKSSSSKQIISIARSVATWMMTRVLLTNWSWEVSSLSVNELMTIKNEGVHSMGRKQCRNELNFKSEFQVPQKIFMKNRNRTSRLICEENFHLCLVLILLFWGLVMIIWRWILIQGEDRLIMLLHCFLWCYMGSPFRSTLLEITFNSTWSSLSSSEEFWCNYCLFCIVQF